MNITKYGHSALHIDHKGVGFFIDPGAFSTLPEKYPQTDALILTHEHADHFQIDEVKKIIAQYPDVVIVTNKSIAEILAQENITAKIVGGGESVTVKGVTVTGVKAEHAEIFCDYNHVTNIGYVIDEMFFHPGDSYAMPPHDIEILALPIVAPWMAIKEAINYIHEVKPKHTIPVHDAILSDMGRGLYGRVFEDNTKEQTKFHPLDAGESVEL